MELPLVNLPGGIKGAKKFSVFGIPFDPRQRISGKIIRFENGVYKEVK